jgi:hypothetical protein
MDFLAQCAVEDVLEGASQRNGWKILILSSPELLIVIHKPQNGVGGV